MAKTHFSGRTLARSQALQLLFQAEATGRLVSEVLSDSPLRDEDLLLRYQKELDSRGFSAELAEHELAELESYTRELALGVDGMLHELDAVIGATSASWSVSRMPAVDRNLLRLALYEMLEVDAVDTAVAIDECVELAKAYGTDESSRFVNGILGKIARRIEAGEDVVAVDCLAAGADEDADEAEAEAAEELEAPADAEDVAAEGEAAEPDEGLEEALQESEAPSPLDALARAEASLDAELPDWARE